MVSTGISIGLAESRYTNLLSQSTWNGQQGWGVISSKPLVGSGTIYTATGNVTGTRILVVPASNVKQVCLVYYNCYTANPVGEYSNYNDVWVRACVQMPQSAPWQDTTTAPGQNNVAVTFGGKEWGLMKGGSYLVSDPVPVACLAGQCLYVKTTQTANGIAAPTAPTLGTATTGGAFSNGTYYASVTYVFQDQSESLASAATSIALSGGTSTQTITVTAPSSVAGAVGYKVYTGTSATSLTLNNSIPTAFGSNYTATALGATVAAPAGYMKHRVNPSALNFVGGGKLDGQAAAGYVSSYEGTNAGDYCEPGSVMYPGGGTTVAVPYAVLGLSSTSPVLSFAGIGDSIMAGTGDEGYLSTGGGFVARACANQVSSSARGYVNTVTPYCGFMQCGAGGESAANFATGGGARRLALSSRFNSGTVWNYGTNDLNGGTSAPALVNYVVTAAGWYTALQKKFVVCTLDPRNSSSDAWSTLANQSWATSAYEAYRRQYNNWLLDTTGQVSQTDSQLLRCPSGTVAYNYNWQGGGDGATTKFLTTRPFVQGTEAITVNGVAQVVTTNYTYTGTQTINGVSYAGGVVFGTAPTSGYAVAATYTKMASFSSMFPVDTAVADTASAVEVNSSGTSGTNGGLWAADNSSKAGNLAVTAVSSNSFTTTTITPTTDQWRGFMVKVTADSTASGAVGECTRIYNNTSAGVFSVAATWGATTPDTNATLVITDPWTVDGTHPSSRGHIAKAVLLQPYLTLPTSVN